MIPAIDDYKKNVIYVNKAQTGQESLYPTLAHEGYPGHLYQTTYFHSKRNIRYVIFWIIRDTTKAGPPTWRWTLTVTSI